MSYSRMGSQKDPLYSIDKLFIRMQAGGCRRNKLANTLLHRRGSDVIAAACMLTEAEMGMKVRQRAVVCFEGVEAIHAMEV